MLLSIICWATQIGTATMVLGQTGTDTKSSISDDIAHAPLESGPQCAPYARQVSGIAIYGDAFTWWDKAVGRYARGSLPRPGAVMVFKPYGKMRLGHVATVSQVLDPRTVVLRHANWSNINGLRGQIEDGVPAVDVSLRNDWSEVRVWSDRAQDLGTTHWPLQGFIYRERPAGYAPPSQPLEEAPGTDPIAGIIAKALRAEAEHSSRRVKHKKQEPASHINWLDVPSQGRKRAVHIWPVAQKFGE